MQNHQAGWHTISFEPLLDITPFQISASPPLAKQCDPIFLTLPVRSSTAGIVFVDWGMQLDSDCTDIQIPDTLVIVAVLRAQPNDFAENEEHTRLYRSVDAIHVTQT